MKKTKSPFREYKLSTMKKVEKKQKGYRDEEHYKYVQTLPCIITGHLGCDAHHILFQTRVKYDCLLVPLSREEHHDFHNGIGWKAWEEKTGWTFEKMLDKAIEIWEEKHPDQKIARENITRKDVKGGIS